MECGARLGRAGGALRLSSGSPSCSGGSASASCSSVSPASESSSSGCVESPLSSSGYSSSDAMPVAVQGIIKDATLGRLAGDCRLVESFSFVAIETGL